MSQQDNAPNKPVHLIYLCGAVLLFYITQWTIDWIWGYFSIETVPSEFQLSLIGAAVAIIVAVAMYRNDKYYTLANEVAGELKKVTWPSAKEVRTATLVVIAMAIIMAVILGLVFDVVWGKITETVYG